MQAAESKALVAVSAAGLAFAGYHLTATTMVPESRLVHAKSGSAPPSYDEEGAARNKQRLVRRPSWQSKFEAPASKDEAASEIWAAADSAAKSRLQRRPS